MDTSSTTAAMPVAMPNDDSMACSRRPRRLVAASPMMLRAMTALAPMCVTNTPMPTAPDRPRSVRGRDHCESGCDRSAPRPRQPAADGRRLRAHCHVRSPGWIGAHTALGHGDGLGGGVEDDVRLCRHIHPSPGRLRLERDDDREGRQPRLLIDVTGRGDGLDHALEDLGRIRVETHPRPKPASQTSGIGGRGLGIERRLASVTECHEDAPPLDDWLTPETPLPTST